MLTLCMSTFACMHMCALFGSLVQVDVRERDQIPGNGVTDSHSNLGGGNGTRSFGRAANALTC